MGIEHSYHVVEGLEDSAGPLLDEHVLLSIKVLERLGCVPGYCEWQAYRLTLQAATRYLHYPEREGPTEDPEAWLTVADVDMREYSLWWTLETRASADHMLWLQGPDAVIKRAAEGDFDEDAERARLRPV